MFLREYGWAPRAASRHSTGKFLDGLAAGQTYTGSPDGPAASAHGPLSSCKLRQARLALKDTDISNVPMVAADPYGNFIPGPAHGLPQYVTDARGRLHRGQHRQPRSPSPADVVHFDTPFLTDIAHNADPGAVGPCSTTGNAAGCLDPDGDNTPNPTSPASPRHVRRRAAQRSLHLR